MSPVVPSTLSPTPGRAQYVYSVCWDEMGRIDPNIRVPVVPDFKINPRLLLPDTPTRRKRERAPPWSQLTSVLRKQLQLTLKEGATRPRADCTFLLFWALHMWKEGATWSRVHGLAFYVEYHTRSFLPCGGVPRINSGKSGWSHLPYTPDPTLDREGRSYPQGHR
jgi:hypothetical protein